MLPHSCLGFIHGLHYNLRLSDCDKIHGICAPEAIYLEDGEFAIFSIKLPTCYATENIRVEIQRDRATISFIKPERIMYLKNTQEGHVPCLLMGWILKYQIQQHLIEAGTATNSEVLGSATK